MRLLYLDGNICTGKSSTIKYLRKTTSPDEFLFLPEPINTYESLILKSGQNVNCLKNFYDNIGNPETEEISSVHMQLVAMSTLSKQYDHLKYLTSDPRFCIGERGLHSVEIFSHAQYKLGYITELTYTILQFILQQLRAHFPQPELIFHLTAPSHVLYRRIRQRQRLSEKNITRKYLKQLCQSYDKFLGPIAIAVPTSDNPTATAEKIFALITLYKTNMTKQELQTLALNDQDHWGLLENPTFQLQLLNIREEENKPQSKEKHVTFELPSRDINSNLPNDTLG